VLFGTLRVGWFISYTPYSVVSGFMSGIGIIIITIQVLPFLGLASVPGGPLGAILAWPKAIANLNPQALAIAGLSLGIAIYWPAGLRRLLPSPLAALVSFKVAQNLQCFEVAGSQQHPYFYQGSQRQPDRWQVSRGSDSRPLQRGIGNCHNGN